MEIDPNLCKDDGFNIVDSGNSIWIMVALSDDVAKQTIAPDEVGSFSVRPTSRPVMGLFFSSEILNVCRQCLAQLPDNIAAKMMRPFASPENTPFPVLSQAMVVTLVSWALCRSQACMKGGLGDITKQE